MLYDSEGMSGVTLRRSLKWIMHLARVPRLNKGGLYGAQRGRRLEVYALQSNCDRGVSKVATNSVKRALPDRRRCCMYVLPYGVITSRLTSYRPRDRETICPSPPMEVRLAADLRSRGLVVVVTFLIHNFVNCKATLISEIKNLRNKIQYKPK